MRVLLMISNANTSARELYTAALRRYQPAWGISNMSGLPSDAASIVRGFDLLVYELGRPDDARRHGAVSALWDELRPLESTKIVTHVEGPLSLDVAADLEARGIICVQAPLGLETIAAALSRAAPPKRPPAAPDGGIGRRLRSLFTRRPS